MNIYHLIFLTTNFLVTYMPVGPKPLTSNQRTFSENKLQCMEEDQEPAEKSKAAAPLNADYYQPNHPKYEVSDNTKLQNGPQFDFKQKRTVADNLQKRQVGVIYREEKPIGILQPYQRSYRFIPVKEENAYALETNPMNPMNPIQEVFSGQSVTVDKRNIKDVDEETAHFMKETYPQILANFKLDSKLEKKRSESKQPISDDNIRDLKATIRKLRSASDSHHAEKIEEQLKGILDDMGLIEDEEAKGTNEKREASAAIALENNDDDDDDPLIKTPNVVKDRNKRDFCNKNQHATTQKSSISMEGFPNTLLGLEEKKTENSKINKRQSESDETDRNKRDREQREQKSTRSNVKEDSELLETLKDSGDLMVSGNKSPLASSSEVRVRESGAAEADTDDQDYDAYENRVERQIQDKIQSLKEEVKREIEVLKDEEAQRRKRQTMDQNNLVQGENDAVNPIKHPDSEMLKPLIRRRRNLDRDEEDDVSMRRLNWGNNDCEPKSKRHAKRLLTLEEEEGGELLGDDYEDKRETKMDRRRSILEDDEVEDGLGNEDSRDKRGQGLMHSNFYESNNDLYEDESGDRLARQNFEEEEEENEEGGEPVKYKPLTKKLQRSRRRISEEQSMDARPQQLSDMSDIDLFGALPKSYDGELSRYKRVKRIKM